MLLVTSVDRGNNNACVSPTIARSVVVFTTSGIGIYVGWSARAIWRYFSEQMRCETQIRKHAYLVKARGVEGTKCSNIRGLVNFVYKT